MGFLRKHLKLIIMIVVTLVVVNASIFGTLWLLDHLAGPSKQELYDLRQAEVQTAQQALYEKLDPLDTKSRVDYLSNIGQAIDICENKLHAVQPEGKSWQIKIDSKYVSDQEKYYIFMEYHTLAKKDEPSKAFEVTCEVLAESGNIENWKANSL